MDTNTAPKPAEDEDRSDHYKPLTIAELDRLVTECTTTEDWFDGQKLALRVFRAAPNPHNAEAARQAFKTLVNAKQGRDDLGEMVPGGISASRITTLRNELLALLGIGQAELFAPEPTRAEQLRQQAAEIRKRSAQAVADSHYSDAPGAVRIATEDAALDNKRAEALEAEADALEGGAK